MSMNINRDRMARINNMEAIVLDQHHAALNVDTGSWVLIDDERARAVSWRIDDIIARVFRRLQNTEAALLTRPLFTLIASPPIASNEYCKNVIIPLRRETWRHMKHIKGIQQKAVFRLRENWKWYIGIPIIGYIFWWRAANAEIKLKARFAPLFASLTKRYADLREFENKVQKIAHISTIIKEVPWITKIFTNSSRYDAEQRLLSQKIEYLGSRVDHGKALCLLRHSGMDLDQLVFSKLDFVPGNALIQHIPIRLIRKKQDQFLYVLPHDPNNLQIGHITARDLGALQQYLYGLIA